jgi:cytoskeleton protein RodZ
VGEFGDKFRKAREKKNFSFEDVSQVTKIGARMLQAIEGEHFDRLPGGVFNKGFIRTYAKHLGMNDDEAVASYLACVRQAQVTANQATADQAAELSTSTPTGSESPRKAAPSASRKKSSKQAASAQVPAEVEELPDLQLPRAEHVRPPRRENLRDSDAGVPWRIVVVAGVVIVLALIVWNRHSHRVNAQSAPSAANSAVAVSTPAPISPNPASASYQTASVRTGSAMQSPRNQPIPAAKLGASASESAAQGSNSGAAPLSGAPEKPAAPLSLIIRATENSWISVRADGQEVTAETLIAPAHTSIRAGHEIVVKTGNAAGVNFVWNGQEVPTQGAEDEVKTFVFDASGLRTAPPNQPTPQPKTQNQ